MYPLDGSWTVICLKHFQSEFNISTKGIINNEFTSKSFFTFVWFLNDLWNSHISFIEVSERPIGVKLVSADTEYSAEYLP